MSQPIARIEHVSRTPASSDVSPYGRLIEWFARPGTFLVRPPEAIANLPVRYRWEFTRRHPHYLLAWDEVQKHRRGESARSECDLVGRVAGQALLMSIGIHDEPVDPGLPFDHPEFGGQDPLVIAGACQPVTLRTLAMLLVRALPPGDRRALGTFIHDSGSSADVSPEENEALIERGLRLVNGLPCPALNSYSLFPLFHLNLDVSQRTIIDDVTDQVRRRQRGKATTRAIRPELLDSYLEVWDEREGWTGSGYARREARTFPEIATAQSGRRQTSTAFDRYRRAFELIVGRPYTVDLWWNLLGRLKFGRYFCDPEDGTDHGPSPQRNRRRPRLPHPDEVLPRIREWRANGVSSNEIGFRLRIDEAIVVELLEELEDRVAL